MRGARDEVVGQAEDDQMGDRFPGGFHPAREVDGLQGEVLAEAFLSGEAQGEPHPGRGFEGERRLMVGPERGQGVLDGFRDLGGEFDREGFQRARLVLD